MIGFLRLSDAINRLANGIWGGLPRPVPVQEVKQTAERASVGYAPWREYAAEYFRTAALEGALPIYVIIDAEWAAKNKLIEQYLRRKIGPTVIPKDILRRLMISRRGIPDHAIRPTLKTTGGDQALYTLLTVGVLVVNEGHFERWYRSERRKRKWPSQASSPTPREGRPTKQTTALKNAVLALVRDGAWSGNDSFAKLRRLLLTSGRSDVPSLDTLNRLVRALHRETGEPGLLRIGRVRRSRRKNVT